MALIILKNGVIEACQHESTEPVPAWHGWQCRICGYIYKEPKLPLSTADQCGPGAYSNEYD